MHENNVDLTGFLQIFLKSTDFFATFAKNLIKMRKRE